MMLMGNIEGLAAGEILFQEMPVVTGTLRTEDKIEGSGFHDIKIREIDGLQIISIEHKTSFLLNKKTFNEEASFICRL